MDSTTHQFSRGKMIRVAVFFVVIGFALVAAGIIYPAHTKILTVSLEVSGTALIAVFGYALIQSILIFRKTKRA